MIEISRVGGPRQKFLANRHFLTSSGQKKKIWFGGPSNRWFLAFFRWNLKICRNFERFVFQLIGKKLLKFISAKWGVRGPRKFFWEMYLIRNLTSFFGLSEIFLFVKWQVCELFRLICRREVGRSKQVRNILEALWEVRRDVMDLLWPSYNHFSQL